VLGQRYASIYRKIFGRGGEISIFVKRKRKKREKKNYRGMRSLGRRRAFYTPMYKKVPLVCARVRA